MLEKTWRWFGKGDKISLNEIRQIGVEGVVTALHHIPNGEVWSVEEINLVKEEIEKHGMHWSVVESLPVHEEIKYGGPNRDKLIENYKQSLANIGKCGIDTICYNFMPVIDWIRTDLHHTLENGTESLFFDFAEFVIFDRYILGRVDAENEYPKNVVEKAKERFRTMTTDEKVRLIDTIIVKTQGFIDGIITDDPNEAVEIFKNLVKKYSGIGKPELRENLKYFLEAIIPVAEEAGVSMCIHPDDPPMKVLGLPRIAGSYDDIKWITEAVDSEFNGVTFCAGSLSAGSHNDLTEMIRLLSKKVHFIHLRSTQLCENGDFFEAEHLKGNVEMAELVKELLLEQKRRRELGYKNQRMPMRVDHGHRLLHDFDVEYNPGYPLIGRLKGLSEIDGLQQGIASMLNFN
jgi:mannonate dehydratase